MPLQAPITSSETFVSYSITVLNHNVETANGITYRYNTVTLSELYYLLVQGLGYGLGDRGSIPGKGNDVNFL